MPGSYIEPSDQYDDRVALPLIGGHAKPAVTVTNDDIAAALEAEDVERHTAR
jgi:hypothetical protein